mgnify:FL=1
MRRTPNSKDWRILKTVLLAVAFLPALLVSLSLTGVIVHAFRDLLWDLNWLPVWTLVFITLPVALLGFAVPVVGVVWLMIKIWKRKPPRITEGKG